MNMEKEIFFVHVDDIIPNRFQPREIFDETALVELSESIKEHGIIQPLVVRKIGDKYEIIAGERRYKASLLAGLNKVPVIVADLDDQKSAEIALAENVQRRDLTAIEEAKTYQRILKLGDLTQEELAKRMGKAQPTIANKLRLLGLDDTVQQALLENKISERHARSLLNLGTKDDQKEVLDKIINNKLTVRDTDNEIKNRTGKNIVIPAEESSVEIIGDDNLDIAPKNLSAELPTINADNISPVVVDAIPSNIVTPIETNNLTDNMTTVVELPKIEEQLVPSRFFMPLEEEETNMDMEASEPKPEIQPVIPVEEKAIEPIIENNNVPVAPIEVTPEPINVPTSPVIESQPLNIPNFQSFQSTAVANDLRTAINTIRQCVDTIEKYGFDVDSEEFDFEDVYQVIIKINK